jgi:steroid delta-isomerase-like uncharacterized protein
MTESKSRQLVERVLSDLWNDGKTTAIDDLYASELTVRVPGSTFKGRDGIQQFIGMYHEAFPDLHVEMEGFYPNDSDTGGVLHWRFTGTHKGELMGIAPTDNPVSIEGMTLSRHRDGKIYEEQFLWDRLEQLRQLGVSPDELEG